MAYITVHGRFSRDPELSNVTVRNEPKSVCRFSIAEDKRFGEDASFYDCQAWGKSAEFINAHFFKGKECVVCGNFEQEPYTDKDGAKKRPWRLTVDRIDFCGKPDDTKRAETNNESDSTIPEGFKPLDEEDDDIPF